MQPSDVQSMPIDSLIGHVITHASDPYACLGLPASATVRSVRSRYLALVLRLHPDKASEQPRAREAFNAVDDAFRRLKRSHLRR